MPSQPDPTTLLHIEIESNNADGVREALGLGADPYAGLRPEDKQVMTAMKRAVVSDLPGIVEVLIEQGVPVDTPCDSDGATGLHFAVLHGRHRIVEVLVRLGADVTIRNGGGHTAYRLALEKYGDKPTTRPGRVCQQVLLAAGAAV